MSSITPDIFMEAGLSSANSDAFADVGLVPSIKHAGTYKFIRRAYESEVIIIEPDTGDSYLLNYFRLEVFLDRILKMDRSDVITICDRIWNFRYIVYDTITGLISRFEPSPEEVAS